MLRGKGDEVLNRLYPACLFPDYKSQKSLNRLTRISSEKGSFGGPPKKTSHKGFERNPPPQFIFGWPLCLDCEKLS